MPHKALIVNYRISMKRRVWWGLGLGVVGLFTLIGLHVVRSPEFAGDFVSEEQQAALESGLTLRNVTLEQQDEDGQLLWRVNADAVTYSPDQASADLTRIDGELYQDGAMIYQVEADSGFIRENGQVIFLQDNILAIGVQNQMTLQGQVLEWRPEEDVLNLKGGLTGSHPQVRLKANEAFLYDRESRMVLVGQVVATTVVENPQEEPWLKLQGDALNWRWQAEVLDSQQPLRVERFSNQRITEVLTGQQGLVELAKNQATFTDDVKMQIVDIPLLVSSDRAIWQVAAQKVDVDQPLQIVDQKENVTATAQQGQLDLATQTVLLSRDVLVVGEQNASRLTTQQLTWNLLDQTVLAQGAVDYRQGEPPVAVRGPRARGRIEAQTIVVDGGRVVTEIVPLTQ